MFIEAIVIGIIIGFVRKGKIARLSYVNFNMTPLIYISALLYFGIVVMNLGLFNYNSSLYNIFLICSCISVGCFLAFNMQNKFMSIPLIGLCLNLFCFIVNGFKFPISSSMVSKFYGAEIYDLLLNGKVKFFMPTDNASFGFLGSIIPIDKYFSAIIISAGDVVIAIGIILIVQSIMADRFIQTRSNITFSKRIFK